MTLRCSAVLAFEYEDDQLGAIANRLDEFASAVREERAALRERHGRHAPTCDICRPEVHE